MYAVFFVFFFKDSMAFNIHFLAFIILAVWLSAQGDEARTAELAPSGFDVKLFPRQSRFRGGGIATVCKSTLGSNITFKTNFDFTHTSLWSVRL